MLSNSLFVDVIDFSNVNRPAFTYRCADVWSDADGGFTIRFACDGTQSVRASVCQNNADGREHALQWESAGQRTLEIACDAVDEDGTAVLRHSPDWRIGNVSPVPASIVALD